MLCMYIHCQLFKEDNKKREKQKVILSDFPLNVVIQIGGHTLLKFPPVPIISVQS